MISLLASAAICFTGTPFTGGVTAWMFLTQESQEVTSLRKTGVTSTRAHTLFARTAPIAPQTTLPKPQDPAALLKPQEQKPASVKPMSDASKQKSEPVKKLPEPVKPKSDSTKTTAEGTRNTGGPQILNTQNSTIGNISSGSVILNANNVTIGNMHGENVIVNDGKKGNTSEPKDNGKSDGNGNSAKPVNADSGKKNDAPQTPPSKGTTLPKPTGEATRTQTQGQTTTQRRPEDTLVSLESSNLELPVILKALSEQTNVNLILLGSSDKKLTIRLRNVKLSEMLSHISALSSLEYLKVGNTFVVAPAELLKERYPKEWEAVHPTPPKPVEPKPEPAAEIVERTYFANNAQASSLAQTLTALYKDKGLEVIVGPALTAPTISTRDTSSTTGVAQGVLTRDEGAAQGGRVLILRGPAPVVAAALKTAKALDTERPQVSIKVEIHDISRDAMKELGLSWNFGNLNFSEGDPRGINFGSFTRAPFNFGATIRALETKDAAKLLASPSISVLDGERAFILIGSRLNFPVLIGYSASNNPIFDKQEERVGIYLQVASSVADDGQITLSLYPQVSTVTGFLTIPNGGSYPQIATREAQTTLRVRSGETIVLGGMLRSEEIDQLEKVPILSQIPILGELFTRRKKQKGASEVIISMTPVIISSAGK